MILVALLYAILASTFIFAKQALAYSPPFFLIGFRMILAGIILLSYYRYQHGPIHIKREDYGLFFRVAWFHIFCAFVLEFWALQYLSALKTTVIYSATPFITALLAFILLKESLSYKKVLGILVGLAGLLPVFIVHSTQADTSSLWLVSVPDCVLLLAVISSAYAWFLVKQLMTKGYSLVVINGVAMLLGGILSYAISLVFEGFGHQVTNWPAFLWWVILLIIVSNVLVYNFYGYLMHRYSITFISFSGFLCPGFAALYEWLFMGGSITWHYLASLALVTAGLYIFYRDELKIR